MRDKSNGLDENLRRTSDHLVRGVDFLFALTLGQGILLFGDYWRDPLTSQHLTATVALVTIYVTTIQSFIDWHLAMERDPYRIGWDNKFRDRTGERLRFTTDLLIVATYAFLLLNAVPLITEPDGSLNILLAGFPTVFAFYLLWWILRHQQYPDVGSPLPMVGALIAFLVLYGIYRGGRDCVLGGGAQSNNISLLIALAVTLAYRVVNALGGETWRST
jgi:hypothetical protein